MKIGVLSDTHLSSVDDRFVALVRRNFRDVDAIIHAGDMVDASVFDFLSEWELYAVLGNMDRGSLVTMLPVKRVARFGDRRIGIMHGWGSPNGIALRVREEFSGDDVDCIVFGHSHAPYSAVEEGVLLFNPGSPTDKRFTRENTIGYLTITEDGITGEVREI